jgi:hypothetical protein
MGFTYNSPSNSANSTHCYYAKSLVPIQVLTYGGQTGLQTPLQLNLNHMNAGLGNIDPKPWSWLNSANTHPYSPELIGMPYPYPGLTGMPHYGNWTQ